MAEEKLYNANLSRLPLRILASPLPAELPSVGYVQLLAQDTVDGVRAYLRKSDGSLIALFTEQTVIDETVTNNTFVYNMADLPPAANLFDKAIPHVQAGTPNTWSWSDIATLILGKGVKAYRDGIDVTTSRAIVSGDMNSYLSCTATLTLTLPSLTVNKFSELEIARNTSGVVGLSLAAGVTINGSNAARTISKQYGVVVLKNIGPDTWVCYGDLT